jgi:hypothetical protein
MKIDRSLEKPPVGWRDHAIHHCIDCKEAIWPTKHCSWKEWQKRERCMRCNQVYNGGRNTKYAHLTRIA